MSRSVYWQRLVQRPGEGCLFTPNKQLKLVFPPTYYFFYISHQSLWFIQRVVLIFEMIEVKDKHFKE